MIHVKLHWPSIQKSILSTLNPTQQTKNKGIKKGLKGIDFENYAKRVKSLKNFDSFEQPKKEYKRVGRFIVKKGQMVTTSVVKTIFTA